MTHRAPTDSPHPPPTARRSQRLAHLLGLALAACALLACLPAAAQEGGRDMARAYYESGIDLLRSGRTAQGLEDLRIVLESYGGSAWADDALLATGIHFQEGAGNPVEALRYFNTIILRHASSNSTPEAYLRKGEIFLAAARGREELLEASAAFERIIRLYPDTPLLCQALVRSAATMKRLGESEAALARLLDLRLLQGECPAAAQADWEAAILLMEIGRPLEAIRRLQSLRDRHPSSPEAARALGALALLCRLELRGGQNPSLLYQPDSTFSLGPATGWKNPVSLRVATDGRIVVADRGRGEVLVFGADGRLAETIPVEEAGRVAVSPSGEILVGAGLEAVIVGGGRVAFAAAKEPGARGVVSGYSQGPWAFGEGGAKSGAGGEGKEAKADKGGAEEEEGETDEEGKKAKKQQDEEEEQEKEREEESAAEEGTGLKRLEAVLQASLTESWAFLVLSRNRNRVDLFTPPAAGAGTFDGAPLAEVVDPQALEVDREGRIFVLSGKDDSVAIFDSRGARLAALGGKQERLFQRPVDLAVDTAGNLYVLETRPALVRVFSRAFQPLFAIPLDESTGLALEKPAALSVGPDGALYVLDGGAKSVLCLR